MANAPGDHAGTPDSCGVHEDPQLGNGAAMRTILIIVVIVVLVIVVLGFLRGRRH